MKINVLNRWMDFGQNLPEPKARRVAIPARLLILAALIVTPVVALTRAQTATNAEKPAARETASGVTTQDAKKESGGTGASVTITTSDNVAAGGSSSASYSSPEPQKIPGRTRRVITAQASSTGGPGTSYGLKWFSDRAESQVLCVTRQPMEAAAKHDIEEDMAVMARILEKAARGRTDDPLTAFNIKIQGLGGAGLTRHLYLEDYGVLFFFNVSTPLRGEREKTVEKKTVEDSAWEEARREVYGTADPVEHWPDLEDANRAKYDPDKVEQLKNKILDAMKNATHIRHLKPGDNINVILTSGNRESRMFSGMGGGGGMAIGPGMGGGGGGMGRMTPGSADSASTLILSCKKADVDTYASGKTSREEFCQKVTVILGGELYRF